MGRAGGPPDLATFDGDMGGQGTMVAGETACADHLHTTEGPNRDTTVMENAGGSPALAGFAGDLSENRLAGMADDCCDFDLVELVPRMMLRCRGPDDLTIHDAPACPPSAVPLDRVLIGLITGLSPTSQLGCIPGLIVARMGPDCRKAQEHPSPLQLPGGALHLRPLWIPLANAVPVSCTVLGQKGPGFLVMVLLVAVILRMGCILNLSAGMVVQVGRKAQVNPQMLQTFAGAPCGPFVWGKLGPLPGVSLPHTVPDSSAFRDVADCFECLSALSRNFNYLNACRVGEASNPGPGPKAPAGLQQFTQQAGQKAIQEAIANLDLSSLVGNVVAATPAPTLPPAGSRAHRRKKAKLKKAAATLARAAGSQGQPRHPTPLSASPTESADAKARGKGNNANSRPAKARGNSEETQDPNAGGKGKGTGKGQHDAGPQRAEADWTTVQRRRQGKPETPWTLCSEDWDATVCAYQGVAEALQNVPAGGSFRAVVLCNSKDQTDTIAGLLRNSGTQHAVRLVVVADKASEGERCPGRVGTQRAFRHVHFAKVFTAGLQAIVALSGQGLFVDPSKRSGFPEFTTEWVDKLPREQPLDYLARAGALGAQFGLDPSKRSGFPEFTTEWVDKLPREQPLDYLARAGALGAQFGLVCGTRSLGRRTARDPSKPTARTWMLENTPHSWTPAQAERAVSTIFTEVKMLRQRRHRSGCTFSFRGSHTTTHDMIALPLEAENGSEGITLWCRWAPPARTLQRQAIHTSGSWSLVRPADPFAATETTVQAAPECGADPLDQADADMSTEDKAQVLSEDKAKAGCAPLFR
eukprot:s10367_g1.t1